MNSYIINNCAQPTGEHEIHIFDCCHLPERKNQVSLGYCYDFESACRQAKNMGFNNVDGCFWCLPMHHKK